MTITLRPLTGGVSYRDTRDPARDISSLTIVRDSTLPKTCSRLSGHPVVRLSERPFRSVGGVSHLKIAKAHGILIPQIIPPCAGPVIE